MCQQQFYVLVPKHFADMNSAETRYLLIYLRKLLSFTTQMMQLVVKPKSQSHGGTLCGTLFTAPKILSKSVRQVEASTIDSSPA